MDFRDSPEDAEYRTQVRDFMEGAVAELPPFPDELEPRLPLWRDWQRQVFDAGYAGLSWSKEYGGQDATLMQQAIYGEEADRAGAPDRLNMLGEGLAGPTIIDFGTDRQKADLLKPILTGEHVWCQLYSEPGAGSDLAALDAKAVRDGDGWRITGQKVWTSRAQVADYGMLLARTTSGARHKGITYFLLPMDTEGVTIRPLRHLLGEAEFNEVFLEDAYVPDDLVIGEVDDGWRVAMATLSYERVTLATGRVNMQRLFADLLAAIREDGCGDDPFVRRRVAELYARLRVYRVNGLRALDAMHRGRPGPESSIGKLLSAPLLEDLADFAMERHGLRGQLLDDEGEPSRWLKLAYQARGTSIAGGTTFIQRNIVSERVLGLPR
ncbi:MAG: hypothetical protein QOF76_4008 [Solirubrobacteraceae bacterium]|jgi:alkylation response protein AidB-like acyl-CoA dehydrogenase|nr:hypothetical protein [Solirubrobacteraceae bacterium]